MKFNNSIPGILYIFKSKETKYSSRFGDIYYFKNSQTGNLQKDRL